MRSLLNYLPIVPSYMAVLLEFKGPDSQIESSKDDEISVFSQG
jgi:hypothetical protein